MKSLNIFIQEGSSKKCPQGQYYCFTDKKCKKIPGGYFVGRRGYLEPEEDSDSSKKNGKNGNGNGNGSSNGNGNGGNGNGNGGGNGGGMSEELNKDDKPEAAVYRKFINTMKEKTKSMNEGSLRKWFKGSKSKDGKGGWVNVVTGGTCASDEPGEGTPKCVSSSKRASMTKAERLSASRRKKKADPGQQSKSGAAKPTYVSTDKKKMKEEIQITEADKKGKGSGTKDACYHKVKSRYSVWPSAYASGALVKCRKAGAANWGNKSEELKLPKIEIVTEVSKKTLGSYVKKAATEIGTSAMKGDYKKMQKRHKGVLDASDKLQKEGVYTGPNKEDRKVIKKLDDKDFAKKAADYEKNMDPKKRQELKDKATKGMKFTHEGTSYGLYKGSGKAKGAMKDFLDKKAKMLTKKRNAQSDAAKNNPHFDSTQPSPSGRNKYEEVSFQQFQEKCWTGYEKKGMKTMFGKRYPNCVKKK